VNLLQHAQSIAEKVGLTDAATVAKVKGWLAERHEHIWNLALWRDALTLYTPAVDAGATHWILPDPASAVPAAAWDRRNLFPADEALQFTRNLESLFNEGDPLEVADVGTVGLAVQPEGEALVFVSDDAGDTSSVTVEGMLAGVTRRETVTLTGTDPAGPTEAFDLIRSFSRTVGSGTVSACTEDELTVLGTLGPAEIQKRHVRLRLLPAALAAGTMLILAKRTPPAFTVNAAVMGLPAQAEAAVAALAHANAHEWMRQYAKAADKVAEAQAFLKVALDQDVFTTMRRQQIVPADGVGNCRAW